MNTLFKWVHLSDLHYRTQNKSFNSQELKRQLPQYLSAKIKSADALILTGDYRFGPDKEDNPQSVADYIREIARALGIPHTKIYIVPGNHDLKRGAVRTAVIKEERGHYSPTDGTFEHERLQSLQSNFGFFNNLRANLDCSDFWCDNTRLHHTVELEHCNLLLLNTAITAGGDDDEHHLLLGSAHLAGEISTISNNKPIIAIGHHGLDFLSPEEEKTCSTFLERNKTLLYLCGHSHDMWSRGFGEKGKQVNVGCLMQSDQTVVAGFSVGELLDDGTICMTSHKWDIRAQAWDEYSLLNKRFQKLYEVEEQPATPPPQKKDNPFTLRGYVLLGGRGIDGIKYLWEKDSKVVESIAFNRRLKESNDPEVSKISAYTTSVSYGCQLSSSGMQCRFCETGLRPYQGNLRAEDIALQNIFMAEYDSDCPSFPQVRDNSREFAYMGQGEPGFNYASIRRAILLTDHVMEHIGQKVYRHIISTCGITDFMPALINDISQGVFKNKVTVHFSLHEIDRARDDLMPINRDYDYSKFIQCCEQLYAVTQEKIGVGILMFNNYRIKNGSESYTLTCERLEEILKKLNRDVFRIDLCDVNQTSTGTQNALRNEDAMALQKVLERNGFEGKTFSSFGDSEKSGCGMLDSTFDKMEEIGCKTISHFNTALELLNDAIQKVDIK